MFNWLIENASILTNVGNGIWIGISMLVSFYMFKLWRKTQDEMVSNLSLGILLVAISSAIHRIWWFTGIATAPEELKYATWATDYRGILTLFVLTLAFGYTLHIKMALQAHCGWWWMRPLIAISLGAALGYAI
jgi:hypothetical protein